MTKKHFKIDIAKIFILLLSCSSIGTQGQSCSHNNFRCSDGRCISTEALCNGRKDCRNGEDERGSGSWSCRSQILSNDICDPASEFQCRFGGCISRLSLCDSSFDCWGGGDEAFDICDGPPPVIPQVSGGSRPRPVTNAPPPQQPKPRPTQAPVQRPQPPIYTPPAPPVVDPPRSQFPTQPSGVTSGGCGPLIDNPTKGFEIACENSRSYTVDCAGASEGTTAIYKCSKYFTPTSSLVFQATRKCQGGQWTPLNRRFDCEADCGISASETGAFIVGGSVAKSGKWPWMVAIYERNPRNGKFDFICGGSLISPKAVVTAAHCVIRRDNGQTKSTKNFKISVGRYYRTYDRISTGVQERDVAKVFVPEDYNHVTLNSDIAIIKLSEAVQITEAVRPVCLPKARDYTEPGQSGTLVGWGRGDNKDFVEQLQQAELPVILSQKCIEAHPQFATLVRKGTFCAGYRNGTSACDGDSGGPLVFRDKFSPSKYILHGVVSAGIASSDGRSGCNPLYYTVFTDVGYIAIRQWIASIIDSNFSSR